MRRKLWAWALALATATAAGPVVAKCQLEKALLPVTMVETRPTVEVTLNGRPVRLEVDSGAFFGMLSPASVAQLSLKTYSAPFGLRVTGAGGDTDVSLTKVELGLLKTKLPDIEFLVGGGSLQADMGTVGVLGRNLLRAFDDEFDFAHGEMALVKAKSCGSQHMTYWSDGGGSMLDMAFHHDNDLDSSIVVELKINGVAVRALMDTGAGDSVLTTAGARKVGLNVNGPGAVRAGTGSGIGRKRFVNWIVPVDAVQIGDEQVKHTKVRVGDFTLTNVDMLLGADFFLSHHVYVSWGQQRVYFTYNGGPVFDLTVRPDAAPPAEPARLASVAAAPPSPGGGGPAEALGDAASAAAAAPSPAPAAGDEPKDADGYSRRGQAYVARRDYTRALADLSRAVELEPQNARYLRERAQLRLLTRQPFLAMADIDSVLKVAPDDPEAHLLRAAMRASGRDRAGELSDLDAADKAASKQAYLRLQLGSMLTGLDENDRAVTQFDDWLAVHRGDSREAQALNGRCWARARAGRDLDQAQRDCDAAVRLQPKTAAFFDSRGLVELKRGDLARARGDYDAALALQPRFPLALYARAVVRRKQGDATGADADTAAAVALNAQVGDLARRAGLAP